MFKVMQQYGTAAQPVTVYYCDDEADLQNICLLYTSDAADELDGVDLGGRRII